MELWNEYIMNNFSMLMLDELTDGGTELDLLPMNKEELRMTWLQYLKMVA